VDFSVSRIIDVIASVGSSLVSSTFVGGRFDAETSKISTDMKQLFTATGISSAHTFRNMLMVGLEQNIDNELGKGMINPRREWAASWFSHNRWRLYGFRC